MTDDCVDHLEFVGQVCPDCNEPVDAHGNTEYQFEHCAFPDCGCDGARLCMTGEASLDAQKNNVEGMWSGGSRRQRGARFALAGRVAAEKKGDPR